MPHDSVSRRKFLQSLAAGSTGAALAAVPIAASDIAAPAGAPFPATVESYPLASPGRGAALDRLKIATQEEIAGRYQQKIQGVSPGVELKFCSSETDFRREVEDAQAIYGHFTRDDLKAAKQLRWIQWGAAGVEHTLYPELVESPIVLTNMQRVYAPAISETAMGLVLALAHGINRYSLQTRERLWKPLDGLFDISGMTMGVVGLGGLGTEIARRAHFGFGMKILAVDPKPIPKPQFVEELHSVDWLPQMVPQVDVLVSSAPHTPASEGMFNEAVFHAMKPSAFSSTCRAGNWWILPHSSAP